MEFGLKEMWVSMSGLVKGVAILLIILSIISVYFFIERQIVFYKAKKKSKQVAPKLAELLKEGKVDDALVLATKKEYKGSHLARVTAAGITEFLEGKDVGLSIEEQIETAHRGCNRAKTMFVQELKRGLNTIATIATSAPFIGLFGTISGIINAFRGMAAASSTGLGAVIGGISEALITTAFGIGVAIIALWCHSFLNTKIEIYEAEMSNTTSQVIDFFIKRSKN